MSDTPILPAIATPKPLCLHCGLYARHRRGLCKSCHSDTAIRNQFGPISAHGNKAAFFDTRRKNMPLPEPTNAPAGSEEKILVLIERFARRQQLFHPDDPKFDACTMPREKIERLMTEDSWRDTRREREAIKRRKRRQAELNYGRWHCCLFGPLLRRECQCESVVSHPRRLRGPGRCACHVHKSPAGPNLLDELAATVVEQIAATEIALPIFEPSQPAVAC